MIRCPIDKDDDEFNLVPFCVRYQTAQMPAKLDVPSPREHVPNDAFGWPEKCNEAIHSLVVPKCRDVYGFSFFRPAAFDF